MARPGYLCSVAIAVVFTLHLICVSGKPFPGCFGGTLVGCPGVPNCTVHHITQSIDHFGWATPLNGTGGSTFKQRYFMADKWWSKDNITGKRGPVFFYFGNEDNVELYVNHTGLMWESAEEFGALLVFAEHRYYGGSLPFKDGTPGCLNFLTTEQAMADFAYLIDHIRQTMGALDSAFIGFGGSYGGMIAAWFRVHYPNAIDGVIAASAPIWSFSGLNPAYDFNAFDKGVTVDATQGGGATDYCAANINKTWDMIVDVATTVHDGATVLQELFNTCSPVKNTQALIDFLQFPWGYMAMGSYPYRSTYLMHGKSFLPPWPVRFACLNLDYPIDTYTHLFPNVAEAIGVYYNFSGHAGPCYSIPGIDIDPNADDDVAKLQQNSHHRLRGMSPGFAREYFDTVTSGDVAQAETYVQRQRGVRGGVCTGDWGYQWCTEMVQPFIEGTVDDMFYCPKGTDCNTWDIKGLSLGCQSDWGVTPRPEWARVMLGGKSINNASNILFSNGLLDPWHGGGVLTDVSETVVALVIPNGGHHVDLMFTDPADSCCSDITAARDTERRTIHVWVNEVDARVARRNADAALQAQEARVHAHRDELVAANPTKYADV